ncbi:hypothetical protein AGMMS50262_02790 [Bacteroidia bacterium]|nr:hypothetical protein AGMMS50262_02790 [Bacteroidia bacterium]
MMMVVLLILTATTVKAVEPVCDLIVTAIRWEPANPAPGDEVTFFATIKNIGEAASPGNVKHGIFFQANGEAASWHDGFQGPLAAGASIELSSRGEGSSGPLWIVGNLLEAYIISAWVNDTQNFEETDYENNTLIKVLTVSKTPDMFHWEFADGTLTIGGTGAMPDYGNTNQPWFSHRENIYNVVIEDGITTIGNYAFNSCNNLVSVILPNSVTSIGDLAFEECGNLTTINIPTSVSSIGWGAFRSCSNLTSINLPEGISAIKINTFYGCSSLTSITIPNSVGSLSDAIFVACTALKKVKVLWETPLNTFITINDEPSSNPYPFAMNMNDVTLIVPTGTKALYETAVVWKDFGKIEEVLTTHWQANSQSYSNTSTFTANVILDNVEMQSDHLEIGAFAGSECRGSVILQNYPENPAHPYLGFLTVYGNDGEEITFKVYNHDTGKEYTASNVPGTFTANAINGNPNTPYTINITDSVTQQIPLNNGWSWISTNVKNAEISLLNQFKSNISSSGVMLKSRNAFIQNPGWIGTLTEITNDKMYMINTTAAQTLPFTGLPADPTTTPISLQNGWNWIGYVPQVPQSINSALANLSPQDGDQIKSYSAYSTYTNGIGWTGSLTTLNPGEGYMYYSTNANAQTFTYSNVQPNPVSVLYSSPEMAVSPKWTADTHRFPTTMTMTSVVVADNLELQGDQIEIGAFAGEECRGSVLLQNVQQIAGHSYLGFLVVYGDNTENIKLRIYDHANDKEYDATNSLSFVADVIHGNPADPYKITANTTGINDVETNVYVTQSGDNLEIHNLGNNIGRLEIIDLAGRAMVNSQWSNDKSINISHLSNGIYVLKMHTGKYIRTQKFLKK